MAGRDSSSKRKSSKRKRDKASSQKKSRRKKQRRDYSSDSSYSTDKSLTPKYASKSKHKKGLLKSRKLSRGHSTSVSSSYDDRAMSSDSNSSLNDYRRRNARRSRLDLKSTKKKALKRSVRLKVDWDAHSGKKRKRLGREDAGKPKNRSSKRKAIKKLSSSESCSTCQSTSSSSTGDSEPKRSKMIPEKEIQLYEDLEKFNKRSRSSSSCERGSGQTVRAEHDDVALSPIVNNSRRLKSVITYADHRYVDEEMEKGRWDMNPHKEEIVYDQNDYPSLKSPDIKDYGTEVELGDQSNRNSSKMSGIENVAGDVADLDKDNDSLSEAIDKNNVDNGKEIDASGLEMILRAKALENLKKFRGRLQTGAESTNLKMNDDSNANNSSDAMVQVRNLSSGSSQKIDPYIPKEAKRPLNSENVEKEHGITTQIAEQPNNGQVLLGCSKEDKYFSSDLGQNKVVSRIGTHPGAKATNSSINGNSEPSSSSSVGPTLGNLVVERENETKDGSSFEQKTMSVMRGGELVQVSYKVYIPKKVPALARRQLKR